MQKTFNALARFQDEFYIVGTDGSVIKTKDGVVLEDQTIGQSKPLFGLASNTECVVLVGKEGKILKKSKDESVFSPVESDTKEDLSSVVWFEGRFVAVGNNGVVVVSSDGAIWKRVRMGSKQHLAKILPIDENLISIGANGLIIRSQDGITWDEVTVNPAFESLTNCCYFKGKYLFFGEHLGIYATIDLTDFEKIPSSSIVGDQSLSLSSHVVSCVVFKDQLIASLSDGHILTSSDGAHFSSIESTVNGSILDFKVQGDVLWGVGTSELIVKTSDGKTFLSAKEVSEEVRTAQTTNTYSPDNLPKEGSNNQYLILGFVLLMCMLVSAIGIFLWYQKKQPK
jgi:trimeric autotransporter adhesin